MPNAPIRLFPAIERQRRRGATFDQKQAGLPDRALRLLILRDPFNCSCIQTPLVTMRRIMCTIVRRHLLCFPIGG